MWTVDGESEAVVPGFEISLAPRAVQRFVLKGDADARAGYLTFVPDEGLPFSGIAVAFLYNFLVGNKVTDTIGLFPSSPGVGFTFPVEKAIEADTEIA